MLSIISTGSLQEEISTWIMSSGHRLGVPDARPSVDYRCSKLHLGVGPSTYLVSCSLGTTTPPTVGSRVGPRFMSILAH